MGTYIDYLLRTKPGEKLQSSGRVAMGGLTLSRSYFLACLSALAEAKCYIKKGESKSEGLEGLEG